MNIYIYILCAFADTQPLVEEHLKSLTNQEVPPLSDRLFLVFFHFFYLTVESQRLEMAPALSPTRLWIPKFEEDERQIVSYAIVAL